MNILSDTITSPSDRLVTQKNFELIDMNLLSLLAGMAGLVGVNSDLVDQNSVIYGDLSSPQWSNIYGPLSYGVTVQPHAEYDATYGWMHHVNPGGDCGNNAGLLAYRIKTPAALTSIVFKVPMKLPTGVASSTVYLGIMDPTGNTRYAEDTFTLTGTAEDCTVTWDAPSANTEYLLVFACNHLGLGCSAQAHALVGRASCTYGQDDDEEIYGVSNLRIQIGGGMLSDDLTDDASDNRHHATGALSRFVFYTDADRLVLEMNSTIYSAFPGFAHIGIKIDGRPYSVVESSVNNVIELKEIDLPTGRTKRVEISTGVTSRPGNTGSVLGTFIRGIILPGDAKCLVVDPRSGPRQVVIYGDSISVGDHSTYPCFQAYSALLREKNVGMVSVEGWGWRTLYSDFTTQYGFYPLVRKIARGNPSVIWLSIGTNDYGLSSVDSDGVELCFQNLYGLLLDTIHEVLPHAKVFAQSPLYRSDQATPNGFGKTLANYRAAMKTACDLRSGWVTYVNGAAILSSGDLHTDGLHPTPAGHAKYADYVSTIITGTNTALQTGVQNITPSFPTIRGAIIKAHTSQTQNLFEFQDKDGLVQSRFDKEGKLSIGYTLLTNPHPLSLNMNVDAGTLGHVRICRGDAVKGYLGLDVTDRPALISALGAVRLSVDTNSVEIPGSAASPLILDYDHAAGILGHVMLKRSAAIKGFIGLDPSDRPALINYLGAVRLSVDTNSVEIPGSAASPLVLDYTHAADLLGHIMLKRSGTICGFFGTNASDRPAIFNSLGAEVASFDYAGNSRVSASAAQVLRVNANMSAANLGQIAIERNGEIKGMIGSNSSDKLTLYTALGTAFLNQDNYDGTSANAVKLNNLQSTQFMRSDIANSATFDAGLAGSMLGISNTNAGANAAALFRFCVGALATKIGFIKGLWNHAFCDDGGAVQWGYNGTDLKVGTYKVYHEGNIDDATVGNATNADTLDGYHAASFSQTSHSHGNFVLNAQANSMTFDNGGSLSTMFGLSNTNQSSGASACIRFATSLGGGEWSTWAGTIAGSWYHAFGTGGSIRWGYDGTDLKVGSYKVYHEGNISGATVGTATNATNATNAVNADTLDSYHAASFALAGHTHSSYVLNGQQNSMTYDAGTSEYMLGLANTNTSAGAIAAMRFYCASYGGWSTWMGTIAGTWFHAFGTGGSVRWGYDGTDLKVGSNIVAHSATRGITGTRTVKDGSGNNKNVTIENGIITAWET